MVLSFQNFEKRFTFEFSSCVIALILYSFSDLLVVRIQQSDVGSTGEVKVRKMLSADRLTGLCGVTEGSLRSHPGHRCVLDKKRREDMTGTYIHSNNNDIIYTGPALAVSVPEAIRH